jgi:DNA polymerase-3 subunit gamma/tau
MSYTVLARRYRSRTFDEVVGQDHVAQTLRRALESGRIAHAFLFCGTRGTGKTSMARILAKSLNCLSTEKPTPKPCLTCSVCESIARGEDMDVVEIDAASNTGVDNIRELIENSRLVPARCRFRVYIIDEVHMLSKGAFNALLKTLEEPPGHVKFILATTETEKIPATILSRCQRYDFRNIPTSQVAEHLRAVCKSENLPADEDALLLVARHGGGSMRDALSLLDRLLSSGEGKLTTQLIERMLGLPAAESIARLASLIASGDAAAVLRETDRMIAQGLSTDALVGALTDHLRDLLVASVCGADATLLNTTDAAARDIAQQASAFDAPSLSQAIALLEELRRSMRTSAAARALLDATLVRLALAEQFVGIEQLLQGDVPAKSAGPSSTSQKKKPEPVVTPPRRDPAPAASAGVERKPAPAPAVEDDSDNLAAPGKVWFDSGPPLDELLRQHEASQGSAPSDPEPAHLGNVEIVPAGDLQAVWDRLYAAIEARKADIAGLLHQGRLISLENAQAVIRYPSGARASAAILERNGKREIVSEVLGGLLGRRTAVRIEVEPEQVSEAPAPELASPKRSFHKPDPRTIEAQPLPVDSGAARVTAEQKQDLRSRFPLVDALMRQLACDVVRIDPDDGSTQV